MLAGGPPQSVAAYPENDRDFHAVKKEKWAERKACFIVPKCLYFPLSPNADFCHSAGIRFAMYVLFVPPFGGGKEILMKIAILNGSPRLENTAAMVNAFSEGAKEAGHEVEILHVGRMKIGGCLGCEYCHGKGGGQCVQKDEMEKVMPSYKEADMIVYASPIYYFDVTAQLSAAMQRVYAIGKPAKAKKAVLLLSSGSPNPYNGAIATYKDMLAYMGVENAGIFTAAGDENGSEAKLAEIRNFAKGL